MSRPIQVKPADSESRTGMMEYDAFCFEEKNSFIITHAFRVSSA